MKKIYKTLVAILILPALMCGCNFGKKNGNQSISINKVVSFKNRFEKFDFSKLSLERALFGQDNKQLKREFKRDDFNAEYEIHTEGNYPYAEFTSISNVDSRMKAEVKNFEESIEGILRSADIYRDIGKYLDEQHRYPNNFYEEDITDHDPNILEPVKAYHYFQVPEEKLESDELIDEITVYHFMDYPNRPTVTRDTIKIDENGKLNVLFEGFEYSRALHHDLNGDSYSDNFFPSYSRTHLIEDTLFEFVSFNLIEGTSENESLLRQYESFVFNKDADGYWTGIKDNIGHEKLYLKETEYGWETYLKLYDPNTNEFYPCVEYLLNSGPAPLTLSKFNVSLDVSSLEGYSKIIVPQTEFIGGDPGYLLDNEGNKILEGINSFSLNKIDLEELRREIIHDSITSEQQLNYVNIIDSFLVENYEGLENKTCFASLSISDEYVNGKINEVYNYCLSENASLNGLTNLLRNQCLEFGGIAVDKGYNKICEEINDISNIMIFISSAQNFECTLASLGLLDNDGNFLGTSSVLEYIDDVGFENYLSNLEFLLEKTVDVNLRLYNYENYLTLNVNRYEYLDLDKILTRYSASLVLLAGHEVILDDGRFTYDGLNQEDILRWISLLGVSLKYDTLTLEYFVNDACDKIFENNDPTVSLLTTLPNFFNGITHSEFYTFVNERMNYYDLVNVVKTFLEEHKTDIYTPKEIDYVDEDSLEADYIEEIDVD